MAIDKRTFDSMAEMTQAADKSWQEGRRRYEDEKHRRRSSFYGRRFESWADIVEKVGEYWPEGLDLMQEMLFELRNSIGEARPRDRMRRARWSADDGDELDIDRLRCGQDYWRQTRREERDAPQHISLAFAFTTPASKDSGDVLWRGAVAIILADLLEAAGFRVEVWGIDYASSVYYNGDDAFHAMRLKASESPVDIASLVNGISGWFYRTVVFQTNYIETAEVTSGLGHYERLSEDNPLVKELIGNAKFIVIDNIWNRRAAENKIKEVMASLS